MTATSEEHDNPNECPRDNPAPDADLDAATDALMEAVAEMTPELKNGEHFITLANPIDDSDAAYDHAHAQAKANRVGICELRKAPGLLRRWEARAKKAEGENERLRVAIKDALNGSWNLGGVGEKIAILTNALKKPAVEARP